MPINFVIFIPKNKIYFMTIFFVIFFLFLSVSLAFESHFESGDPFTYLKNLLEIPRSGDQYPQKLPPNYNPKLYEGLRILFVLSNGAEDHEVYYLHQYFTSRRAKVIFACPEQFVQISDFFKPTHQITCLLLSSVDLNDYDGIYIPGGLPSSSVIRNQDKFQRNLHDFYYNPLNKNKIIMMICSGTENLINSGIIKNTKEITGSPASQWTFYSYFKNSNLPLSLYKGNSDDFPAISYPSDGAHANLVLGRNPDASPWFVVAIANTWKNFEESLNLTNGDDLNLIEGYWYNHPDFIRLGENSNFLLNSSSNLFLPYVFNSVQNVIQKKKIGIAVSSGSHYKEIYDLWMLINFQHKIEFICPSWIVKYKEGKVFVFLGETTPYALINCSIGFDSVQDENFDAIIVPGGLFSTNGVLRNDNELIELLNKSKVSGLLDSGVDLLLPLNAIQNQTVVNVENIKGDLSFSGGNIDETKKVEIIYKDGKQIVISSFDTSSITTFWKTVLGLI